MVTKKTSSIRNKTKRTKMGTGSGSGYSHSNIVCTFLEMLNMVKLHHWKTYSYSTHKATYDIYGSLSDNMDNYAEVMIGKSNGKYRIKMSDFKNLKVDSIANNKAIENKVKHLISDLNKFHSGLQSVEYSDVANIRDEIVADLNKFLYLLTLK